MLSPLGIVYVYGFWLSLPLACLAAWGWGGRAERAAAAYFLIALLATSWVHSSHAKAFLHIEAGVVAVDLVLLVALVREAYRSGRGWLIWACSFQAIASLGHVAKLIRPEMSRLAYGLMEGVSGWPTLVALTWGIWQYRRSRGCIASKS